MVIILVLEHTVQRFVKFRGVFCALEQMVPRLMPSTKWGRLVPRPLQHQHPVPCDAQTDAPYLGWLPTALWLWLWLGLPCTHGRGDGRRGNGAEETGSQWRAWGEEVPCQVCVWQGTGVRGGGLVDCCFTSTETVGLLGMGTQDNHLDFNTVGVLWNWSWERETVGGGGGGGGGGEGNAEISCLPRNKCVCLPLWEVFSMKNTIQNTHKLFFPGTPDVYK